MSKQRWPPKEALIVASELVEALEDATERITIAGSVRRQREDVGDVELVFIPKRVERQATDELFPDYLEPVDMVAERLVQLIDAGVLAKRLDANGRETWGQQNRLAVHVETGIPIDLFATTALCWWNYLVCRTGPAALNTQIASRAKARGWRWHPYGQGFERNGEVHVVESEADVFAFVDLAYRAPGERG